MKRTLLLASAFLIAATSTAPAIASQTLSGGYALQMVVQCPAVAPNPAYVGALIGHVQFNPATNTSTVTYTGVTGAGPLHSSGPTTQAGPYTSSPTQIDMPVVGSVQAVVGKLSSVGTATSVAFIKATSTCAVSGTLTQ